MDEFICFKEQSEKVQVNSYSQNASNISQLHKKPETKVQTCSLSSN